MGLVDHAEREMRLAGLYDKDADYDGMIPEAVMKLIRPFAESGHSGFSAGLTLAIFDKVARFKALTEPTDSPDEWNEVTKGLWQSNRQPDLFSTDGGRLYYSVDDEDRKVVKSKAAKEK